MHAAHNRVDTEGRKAGKGNQHEINSTNTPAPEVVHHTQVVQLAVRKAALKLCRRPALPLPAASVRRGGPFTKALGSRLLRLRGVVSDAERSNGV